MRVNAVQCVKCPHCGKEKMHRVNITYRNYGKEMVNVYRCKECAKYCNEDKLKEINNEIIMEPA